MRMVAVVVLMLGLVGRAHALTARPYDCGAPGPYSPKAHMQSVVQSVVELAVSLLPAFGLQPALAPSGSGWLAWKHSGVDLNVLKTYVMLGGSPVALLNVPLSLVCYRATD